MPIRKPNVDLSKTRARRAPIGECAQQVTASSPWILHLERFLNNPSKNPAPRAYGHFKANIETALV